MFYSDIMGFKKPMIDVIVADKELRGKTEALANLLMEIVDEAHKKVQYEKLTKNRGVTRAIYNLLVSSTKRHWEFTPESIRLDLPREFKHSSPQAIQLALVNLRNNYLKSGSTIGVLYSRYGKKWEFVPCQIEEEIEN